MNTAKDIQAFSRAGISTWFFHYPSRTLFDCGEGFTSTLKEGIFAVENIFLSHGHLDHISGLPTFLFKRAFGKGDNSKLVRIFYPKDSPGVLEIIQYISRILKDNLPIVEWIPLVSEDTIQISRNLFVYSYATKHINNSLTLGFQLFEERKKLKNEYTGMQPEEIILLKNSGIDIHHYYNHSIITYSGDTIPLEKYGLYDGGLLIHECTFLKRDDIKYEVHSCLEDVVDVIARLNIDEVLLCHFSIRYKDSDVIAEASKVFKRSVILQIEREKVFING